MTATCPECAAPFDNRRGLKTFCTPAHQQAWHNRSKKRGGVITPLALGWRAGKSRKGDDVSKRAFADLCRQLDAYNAEDRAAGRPPAYDVIAKQFRTFSRRD